MPGVGVGCGVWLPRSEEGGPPITGASYVLPAMTVAAAGSATRLSDFGTVILDFDARDLSAGAVGSWPNRGNSAYLAAIAASGSARPTFNATGLNSRPAVSFDGVDDFMQSAFLLTLNQPTTDFLLLQITAGNTGQVTVDGGDLAHRHLIGVHQNVTSPVIYAGSAVFDAGANTPALATPYLVDCVFNGASSDVVVDGTTIASGDTGAQAMSGVSFGNDPIHSGAPWKGLIAKYVVFAGALSSGDRASVRGLIKRAWGLP